MKTSNYKTIAFFFLSLTLACGEAEKNVYSLDENAKSYLTSDATKTWKLARRFNNDTRMNMGDCFLSHRETYGADMTMFNNSGQQKDCGETLNAEWKFVKDKDGNYYIRITSEQLPDLMNIEEDFKLFKVLSLSEAEMVLQFNHKQFSSKTTQITDIWVPEDLEIEGREFHW